MSTCVLVVPCYNEAERLKGDEFLGYLANHPETSLVFVNDGSSDGTLALLEELRAHAPGQIDIVDKKKNGGKAEAVRDGLLYAIGRPGATFVGFWDADLATPLNAVEDLLKVFGDCPDVEIVFGARVKLMGRKIERQSLRHYLGRIFATCASGVLDLAIYDTQCGAKFFRVTPALSQVLQQPFRSRWIFDVEMIARFLRVYAAQNRDARDLFYEFPLYCWTDVAGSKIRSTDFLRAVKELLLIRRQYPWSKTHIRVTPPAKAGNRDRLVGKGVAAASKPPRD